MKFSGWRLCTLVSLASLFLAGFEARAHFAPARRNKVIIYPSANETVAQLNQEGITKVDDYGSYWITEVNDQDLAKLKASHGDRVVPADYLNRIELMTMSIDTTAAEPVVPTDLQQTETRGRRLRLIQFKGPIRPGWLEQVQALPNVEIIHYVPNNAYLVLVDAATERKIEALRDPAGPIQWVGAYHPYYKLSLALQKAVGPIDVNVAVVDAPEGQAALERIQSWAGKTLPATDGMLNQRVIRARLDAAALNGIARLPEVLWIDPIIRIRPMDEVQALILASSTNGTVGFGGPRLADGHYLAFLTNWVAGDKMVSFTNAETYPVIDIADSGLNLFDSGGNLILGVSDFSSRVVYRTYDFTCSFFDIGTTTFSVPSAVDPTTTTNIDCITKFRLTVEDSLARPHGTAIASIIAGFNNDPAKRDASGFQFGMGVSPFGLVGSTRVFQPDIVIDVDQTCIYHVDDRFCVTDLQNLIHNEYLASARIANNSWGELLVVGENDGVYNDKCQTYDVGVRDALLTGGPTNTDSSVPLNQEMIMVFANGNAGTHGNPGGQGGGFGDITLTSPASAKNVISVGAAKSVRRDGSGCSGSLEENDSFDIAGYSAFGPTRDGRFKPEIVAPDTAIYAVDANFWLRNGGGFPGFPSPGTDVQGGWKAPVNVAAPFSGLYACGSGASFTYFEVCGTGGANCIPVDGVVGTSFAAPAVSGGIQLLWWYFQNRLSMVQPSPAMAKAYLLNSARYLPITNGLTGTLDKLPSIAQGMGMMDLKKMFDGVSRAVRDETTPRAIDTPLIATNPVVHQTYFTSSGQSFDLSGQVASNNLPFRVTLAWTDAPGDPANFKQLVNDLDLEVAIGDQLYRGNVFVGPNSVPGGAPDRVNPVESVFLDPASNPAVTSGAPWKVVVKAATIAGNGVPHVGTGTDQDFALVVYNVKTDATLSDLPNPNTNDTCQTAQIISRFPYSVILSNFPGTAFHNCHISPTAGTGGAEGFWKLVLPTTGTVVNADTFGSSFNTLLSVWRGACGALIEEVSNNNASNTLQSAVTFTADGTDDYYIVPEGLNNAGGTLQLNVNATAAPVQFVPVTLDFGNVFIGGTSSVLSAVLTNGTDQPLTIDTTSLGGDNAGDFFLVEESCAGNILPPGGSCSVKFQFTPKATGSRSAQLAANDNAIGSPQLLQLIGTGLPPSPLVCLSANSLTFNAGVGTTSAVQNVTVTNCGLSNLTVTAVSISGADAALFHVVTDTCASVAPGDTCTIGVSFSPPDSAARSATLVITHDASGSPSQVSLTGSGSVSQPDAAIGKNTKLKKMVGLNVFSSTGTGEELAQKIKRGNKRPVQFFIALKNNGTSPDRFTIAGDGSGNSGFTVGYFIGATGTTDISGAVTNGVFASGTLAPGAITGDATMIRVEVLADKAVPKNTVKTFTIRFTSASDPTKTDAVKATVIAK